MRGCARAADHPCAGRQRRVRPEREPLRGVIVSAESRYTQQKCHHRRASHQAARVSRGVCSGMLSGALRVMQGTTLATQVACGHAPRHTGKPGLGALVPCSSAARQPVPTCATSLRAGRRGAQGTATPFREVATLSPRRRVKGWGAMQFALARSLSWMALVRGRRAAAEVGVSGWVVVDCEWGRAACRSGFACIGGCLSASAQP